MRPFISPARSLIQGAHVGFVPTCAARSRSFCIQTHSLHSNKIPSSLTHPAVIRSRNRLPYFARHESNSAISSTAPPQSRLDRDQVPSYELTFTCNVCKTRSSHRLSKQGYHNGTVLITCPDCKNRHLISDHLKIFSDKSVTIEDLMREKGDLVKRGSLSAEGDVEFWDDGTSTSRSAHYHSESKPDGDEKFTEKSSLPPEPKK